MLLDVRATLCLRLGQPDYKRVRVDRHRAISGGGGGSISSSSEPVAGGRGESVTISCAHYIRAKRRFFTGIILKVVRNERDRMGGCIRHARFLLASIVLHL